MVNWDGLVKYLILFGFSLYLDIYIFGPLIQNALEGGLNAPITVNGVTAPARQFMDPFHTVLIILMFHIIDIAGISGALSGAFYTIKKFI